MKVSIKSIIIRLVFLIVLIMAFKTMINGAYQKYMNSGLYFEKQNIQNIKYSFDGETFKDMSDFKDEDKYNKKQNMVVTGTINTGEFTTPELFIRTKNNYYDIYIDGERFLNRARTESKNDFVFTNFKELPADSNGKEITIYLYANNPYDIGKVTKLYVSNNFQITFALIKESFISTMFSMVTILIGLLLSMSVFSDRYKGYGLHIIGLFSVLIGLLWICSNNPVTTLYFNDVYFLSFITHAIVHLIPIAILLFTARYETSNTNKRRYKTAINFYLMFLLGVFMLELSGIIHINSFSLFAEIAIFASIMFSLRVFLRRIKLNYRNLVITIKARMGKELTLEEENILKNLNTKKIDFSIFENTMPLAFGMFLVAMMFSLIISMIFKDDAFFAVSTGIATLIFLIFCGIIFSYDLKKVNYAFVVDQEKKLLNNIRINFLVEEQANLFNEISVENICTKFSNKIQGILFPYGFIQENDDTNILSPEVRSQYRKDYDDFINNSSAIIYLMEPDDENFRDEFKNKIAAGIGKYEKYVNKDPYIDMDKDEFGRILFIMKDIIEPDPDEFCVLIGSNSEPRGIVLFSNIGSMEPVLRGLLESYVRTCAILLENLLLINNAKNIQHDTVYNLNEISELRSKETGHHIRRVSLYSALIGKKLGMNEEEIEILQLASSMHDIGKIKIPDAILNKPGKLTDEEFEIMKTHTQVGYDILKNTNNKVMAVGAIVAKYHHEKYNGKGYFGLKGEAIPIMARIVAVTDVFDALSVVRVYKDAWPLEKILDLFEKERNEHFDSNLVDILFKNLDEFIEIRDKYKETE